LQASPLAGRGLGVRGRAGLRNDVLAKPPRPIEGGSTLARRRGAGVVSACRSCGKAIPVSGVRPGEAGSL